MKILKYAQWIFMLSIVLLQTSCVNEPLEGDFPQDDGSITIDEGEFRANVGIGNFSTGLASGVLSDTNLLTITGTVIETSESIILTLENPGVGTFNITAGLGTQNSGVYIQTNPENPFVSDGTFGVFGQLNITDFDTQNATVSGTFSFTGVRVVLDVDGNPVLDSNGQPIFETEEITNGIFNKIPYTSEEQGGGGTPITDEFFAKVDGVNFDAESITTSLNTIAGVSVVKIVAVNELGEIIRIDIPEDTGVGTYAMESLSDGTKLISLFNPATVGENLTSNPGTISITKFNTFTGIIEATFEFTATDPLELDPTVAEITEGSFEVDYISSPGDTVTSFTAFIDGQFFGPDSIFVGESVFNGVSRFNITAIISDTGQKMGLFFPTDIEIGTYEMTSNLINGSEKFCQYTPEIGVTTTYISSPGTLTILDYNQDAGFIEGTFTYSAIDLTNPDQVYEITEGEFTLEF
ncbi:DUF6252 family protein [Flavobacteriaceae bacterium]|nr:DUF6252 family protein [Flavobacteriaceae bacterium]|tara:strand:- start:618 stop:2012 length:1395 start_codon:yes stop_codon:yes gene_type:complete